MWFKYFKNSGREIFDEEQEDWSESISSASGSKKRKKPSNVKAPANGGIAQFMTKGKNKTQTETKTLGLYSFSYGQLRNLLLSLNSNISSSSHDLKTTEGTLLCKII